MMQASMECADPQQNTGESPVLLHHITWFSR